MTSKWFEKTNFSRMREEVEKVKEGQIYDGRRRSDFGW